MNAPVVEGDVIAGKYRVDRVLGRGGMGMVVAASHLFLPHRVAIKLLICDDSPALMQRFLREARAAARLKGEHVVRVLDVGELGSGVPYIVMEYLEGDDLSEVLRARGPLGVTEAADYVLQACVAMAEAHAAGIVHRDLKPANLFLTATPGGANLIKVLDFGISKELPGCEGGAAALTQTREMLGSPVYMPPEQMRSSRSVDARSDIWALGAILYRLLVGRPPFEAPALAELILLVASAEPVPPGELRSDIPRELERVILRCLQKDPAQRPQTVADLALALVPFASAGGQERAERAARILAAPPEPSRPGAAASTSGLRADSSRSDTPGPTASLLPTTRVIARTPAQPAPRRTTPRVALGAAAMASSALAIWAAVALRDGAPEERPALQAAAVVPPAPVPQDSSASRRAGQQATEGEADVPITPEPQPTVQAVAPLPSVSPGLTPPGAAARPAPAPQARRRAPAPTSAPSAAPSPEPPKAPPPPEISKPFEIQLK
ncbi:protein kinase domain-containing protein [Sorangium sp. So ce233]|uniref:serine/threonine-protein kinase n=1 Tax=Sorangium sp. So ce233 TaxID=3133290 RepID=UPI003F5DDE6E